ncbi:hypothetical protein DCO48_05565 [Pseudomonas sp. SDI]|uniref:hypothetical protein n=1 Tax=Pseudomonas sp. SDI TaxID=2170734 RepID=UPI000DE6AE46|nr:hypothetical protein [Pseudomonas sp. SDI]PWB34611.1 hypothetical protein DCO48_05565 [Pseudomonas sp. SDI]
MIELTQLHAAVSATLKAGMPQLATVEALASPAADIPLPALLHGLSGLQSGRDAGDGRCAVLATFVARLLVGADATQASMQAATLAAQLTVLLRKQFWGLGFVEASANVQASAVVSVEPSPYVAWQVQWQQPLYLGEAQWPWPDEPPGSLLVGLSPDTGAGHEADYHKPEDLV